MADETPTDGATPEAEGAMPEPTTPTTTPDAGATPKSDIPDGLTLEDAWKTIQNQRTAERDAKRRADAAEKDLKKIKDAELSEVERLTNELATAVKDRDAFAVKIRELDAKDAVYAAAPTAINPARIWKIVRNEVEYDDDGTASNVKALVDGVKKEFPELFRSTNGSADGGAGNTGKPASGGFNQTIREMAGRPG